MKNRIVECANNHPLVIIVGIFIAGFGLGTYINWHQHFNLCVKGEQVNELSCADSLKACNLEKTKLEKVLRTYP